MGNPSPTNVSGASFLSEDPTVPSSAPPTPFDPTSHLETGDGSTPVARDPDVPSSAPPPPVERASEPPDSSALHAPVTACPSPVMDGMMKRGATALALGVSEATLRRRYQDKELPARKGPDGAFYFDPEQVAALVARLRMDGRMNPRTQDDDTHDELAAVVFDTFAEGVTPENAVRRLRLSPTYVERLYAQWMRLRGVVLLTSEHLSTLEKKLGLTLKRDVTPEEFQRAMEKAVAKGKRCLACGEHDAGYCPECVPDVVKRAERDAKKIERSRAAQEQEEAREHAALVRQQDREHASRLRQRELKNASDLRAEETPPVGSFEQIMADNQAEQRRTAEREHARKLLEEKLAVLRQDELERKRHGLAPAPPPSTVQPPQPSREAPRRGGAKR